MTPLPDRLGAAAAALCTYRERPQDPRPPECQAGCPPCRAAAGRVLTAWRHADPAAPPHAVIYAEHLRVMLRESVATLADAAMVLHDAGCTTAGASTAEGARLTAEAAEAPDFGAEALMQFASVTLGFLEITAEELRTAGRSVAAAVVLLSATRLHAVLRGAPGALAPLTIHMRRHPT